MISDYSTIAWQNLKKRKLRSWLTILGIFIGIMAVVALISLGQGFQKAVLDQFTKIGGDKLFIMPKGMFGPPGSSAIGAQLTTEDVKTVRKVNGVDDATYFIGGNVKVVFDDLTRFRLAYGAPTDKSIRVMTEIFEVAEGRFPREGERGKVVVGSYWANGNIFGKEVKLRDRLLINDKEFTVSGIFEVMGTPDDDSILALSEDDAKELFKSGERVDQIMIKVDSGQDVRQVADRIEAAVRKDRGEKEGKETFYIMTPEDILRSFQSVFLIVQVFIVGIAAISLVVGGIGIMNTMYTSVIERTKEIGIMKAIGARNHEVLLIFLIESGLLGLVGGIIGIALGVSVAKTVEYGVTTVFDTTILQAYFPWYLLLGALAFSFFVGVFSGIFPALQASRLKPVDALRYE